MLKIQFAKPELPKAGCYVVSVFEGKTLSGAASEVNKKTKDAITRAIDASRFQGKSSQTLYIPGPAGVEFSSLLLVGLGKASDIDSLAARNAGGAIVNTLNSYGVKSAVVATEEIKGAKISAAEIAAEMAYGAQLRGYRFDKYRTTQKAEQKPTLTKLTLITPGYAKAKELYAEHEAILSGVFWTRDLASEPANVIFPKSLAAEAQKLKELGVKVEVLGEKEMARLGMNSLLAVGQGSAHESQLVVMRWQGVPESQQKQPIALIGKGVTFDSGGISIKPAEGMGDMKWDMGGSAVVIGLMRVLAARKAKVNVVGVVGLVENMPSGTAQRPGDVVTSMSGQTIEVVNTDAEGRMVLADALWYCQEKYDPSLVIDLATLTGAIMVALGAHHAGLFSNDEELADKLIQAGKSENELLWRMPLGEPYDQMINCEVADMKNTGGRWGGSITAAQFLKRFIKNRPWAHIDIAGVTWGDRDNHVTPKGATAFGVRLLNRFIAQNYEQKK